MELGDLLTYRGILKLKPETSLYQFLVPLQKIPFSSESTGPSNEQPCLGLIWPRISTPPAANYFGDRSLLKMKCICNIGTIILVTQAGWKVNQIESKLDWLDWIGSMHTRVIQKTVIRKLTIKRYLDFFWRQHSSWKTLSLQQRIFLLWK